MYSVSAGPVHDVLLVEMLARYLFIVFLTELRRSLKVLVRSKLREGTLKHVPVTLAEHANFLQQRDPSLVSTLMEYIIHYYRLPQTAVTVDMITPVIATCAARVYLKFFDIHIYSFPVGPESFPLRPIVQHNFLVSFQQAFQLKLQADSITDLVAKLDCLKRAAAEYAECLKSNTQNQFALLNYSNLLLAIACADDGSADHKAFLVMAREVHSLSNLLNVPCDVYRLRDIWQLSSNRTFVWPDDLGLPLSAESLAVLKKNAGVHFL